MKDSREWLSPNNPQTEKQQISKSPLYGYRKPTNDGYRDWCNCVTPTLTKLYMGYGQAHCMRCGCGWYN